MATTPSHRPAPQLELLRIPIAGAEIGLSVLAYAPARPSRSALMMIPGLQGAILGGRQAVGFLAAIKSPYEEAQLRMAPAQRAALDALLETCRALVARGRGSDMVTFEDWFPGRPQALSARSFLGYFGAPAESNASTVKFCAAIKVPALVIHGTKDEVALAPNAEAIQAALTQAPVRELIWVADAGHYLQPGPIAETYALRIADWLARHMPVRPG